MGGWGPGVSRDLVRLRVRHLRARPHRKVFFRVGCLDVPGTISERLHSRPPYGSGLGRMLLEVGLPARAMHLQVPREGGMQLTMKSDCIHDKKNKKSIES